MSLRAASGRIGDGDLGIIVDLLDDQAAPLGQRAVQLRMHGKEGPQRSVRVVTNTDGSTVLHAPMQGGPVEVHAEYVGDALHGPATAELLLTSPSGLAAILPKRRETFDFRPVLDYWTLGPWLLCFIALTWLSSRKHRRSASKPLPVIPRIPMFNGRTGGQATTASSDPTCIAGRVVDDELSLPVCNAEVEITSGQGPALQLFCDHEGRFRSPPLPVGDYRLTIGASGFSSANRDVQVSAQFQAANSIKVELTYLRTALWRHYEQIARASTLSNPRAASMPVDTPREWSHKLSSQTDEMLASALTDIEFGLFAGVPLSTDRLHELCDALTRAAQTRRTEVQ